MGVIDEVVAFAGAQGRPATFLVVNLRNFKVFNIFLGHARGDLLLDNVRSHLSRIGRTWRTGGDAFVTVAAGSATEVTEMAKAFSWSVRNVFSVTESWTYKFVDGREPLVVAHRHFEVICIPCIGLAEIAGDPRDALGIADRECEDSRQVGHSSSIEGFPPIPREVLSKEHRLASRGCPACGYREPTVIDSDLGWSRERCPTCRTEYERSDQQMVLGEVTTGGYM